jgi:hypothetical protein
MSGRKKDNELGLQRKITRRDFLNGFSIAAGGALALPGSAWADALECPRMTDGKLPHVCA